jgi:chloramphenicol 3-O phosphotransferase
VGLLHLVQYGGLPSTLWVGVYCDMDVSSARELARGDRAVGTATYEAPLVHLGFDYDVTVDTTSNSPDQAAAIVVKKLSAS